MSSSKFFTWTKGDRSRNAPDLLYSGAVVPIPVECIHIKGFDYSRTPKASTRYANIETIKSTDSAQNNHRRPPPLRLQPSPEVASPYDWRTDDQATLQDAAVNSAASLIAVVNDMLRSPLASARLPPPSPTLAPGYGRPRACTAPSTPLVEAPSPPPVELPGSTPERPRGPHHHSYDSKIRHSMRPRTHVKRPSHPWMHVPTERKADDRQDGMSAESILPQSPKQRQSGPLTANTCRFSEPVSYPRRIWSDPLPSHGALRPVSISPECNSTVERHTPHLSSTHRPRGDQSQLLYNKGSQSTGDVPRTTDASSLQASHEAHVAALKEAHQREIASLHLYIAQLEPRERPARRSKIHAQPSKSKNTDKHADILLECDHLRNTLERTNTKLVQSQEAMHKLQGVEKDLKATIEDLRSRPSAAQDKRLEAKDGVRSPVGQESSSVHELEGRQIRSPSPSAIAQHDVRINCSAAHDAQRGSEQDISTTISAISSAVSPNPHSSPPPLSPSRTLSPSSALGISMPQTPRTIASATVEALLGTTEIVDAYTQPRTPPTGVHKELPPPPADSSPVPMRLRRGAKMRSVGESIIELYGAGWDCGWSAKGMNGVEETGWVEWV